MADNTELNLGTGGDIIATDDIGSVKHQQVKVEWGANGTATQVTTGASALPIQDGGNTITVDNDGTFAVQIASFDPGTAAASLGKAEDAVHTSGDVGIMALGVRRDADTAFGADGDYSPLPLDANGYLKVNIKAGAGSGGTASTDDAAFTAAAGSGTPMMGFATSDSVDANDVGVLGMTTTRQLKVTHYTAAGTEAVIPGTAATHLGKLEDAPHSSGDTGVMALGVRKDADGAFGADGDYAPMQVDDNGFLKVNIKAGAGAGGTASTDDDTFTAASGSGTPMMGFATSDAVNAGDVGVLAMLTNRQLKVTLYDSGGIEAAIAGGTQYTEDAAAAADPIGNAIILIRDDTPGTVAADGDNVALRGNAVGAALVQVVTAAGADGGVTEYVEDAAADANPAGLMMMAVRKDTPSATVTTDGDNIALRATDYGAIYTTLLTSAGTALPLGDAILVDDAAFTPATTKVVMIGLQADENSIDSVNEGDAGAQRMTLDRKAIVNPQPHTQGGCAIHRSIDLDEGTLEVAKASPGQLYGFWATNSAGSSRYIKFYNATSGTAGTGTPVLTYQLPGNATDSVSVVNGPWAMGVEFSTGICVGCTTGLADADTGAPGTSDVVINVFYK